MTWLSLPLIPCVLMALPAAAPAAQPTAFTEEARSAAPTTSTAPARVELPSFGISVVPPTGWAVTVGRKDPKLVVAYMRVAEQATTPVGREITAAVSISFEGIPEGAPLEGVAKALATKLKGRVVDQRVKLGGRLAAQVVPETRPKQFGYAQHVIGLHGRYVYYVSLSLAPDAPVPDEWYDFVESIQWREFEPAASHLELLGRPELALAKRVALRVPKIAARMEDKPNAAAYMVLNLVSGRAEFVIYLNAKPAPDVPVDEIDDVLARNIQELYDDAIAAPPQFTFAAEPRGSAWTPFFQVRDDKHDFRERWGYLTPPGGQILIVSFRIHGFVAAEDVPAYEAAAEAIARTVAVAD